MYYELGGGGAVNFEQENPNETKLQYLDPTSGKTIGGFAEKLANIVLVGSRLCHRIVNHWDVWRMGVPAIKKIEAN